MYKWHAWLKTGDGSRPHVCIHTLDRRRDKNRYAGRGAPGSEKDPGAFPVNARYIKYVLEKTRADMCQMLTTWAGHRRETKTDRKMPVAACVALIRTAQGVGTAGGERRRRKT